MLWTFCLITVARHTISVIVSWPRLLCLWNLNILQTGVTSRSRTWICGAAKLTWLSLITLRRKVASIMKYESSPSMISMFSDTAVLLSQRWGDAPVHSIAASLFAEKEQVHFFSDIGYRHPPFQHCPQGEEWRKGRCSCNPRDSFGA